MPKYTKLPAIICMDTVMDWNYPEENWKSINYPQCPTARLGLTKHNLQHVLLKKTKLMLVSVYNQVHLNNSI